MAYTEPDDLEEKDLSLIYVAGKTAEAKSVERLLSEHEITYTLMPTQFWRPGLFGDAVELPGVGFYVVSGQVPYCRELLRSNHFEQGLVTEADG